MQNYEDSTDLLQAVAEDFEVEYDSLVTVAEKLGEDDIYQKLFNDYGDH